jgi:hypothetical protein
MRTTGGEVTVTDEGCRFPVTRSGYCYVPYQVPSLAVINAQLLYAEPSVQARCLQFIINPELTSQNESFVIRRLDNPPGENLTITA